MQHFLVPANVGEFRSKPLCYSPGYLLVNCCRHWYCWRWCVCGLQHDCSSNS